MSGFFYLPIFHFAGLNPAPYRAALLLILLADAYWTYYFARLLGCRELAAGLAVVVVCYHAGLASLYYNGADVHDALCWFFYLAAFVYYLRFRQRGRLLGTAQTAVFLALFLCALNSKEMAVTLPPMLVAYEWVYHGTGGWSWSELLAWFRGPARVAVFAVALDIVDVYGKLFGPDPLAGAEAYRPVFTLQRVRAFQRTAFEDLFFWGSSPGWGGILTVYAVVAYLAWRRADRPWLRFLFWFLLLVPVPIEFLVGRRQACLCLLMVGWAIFVSTVLVDAAHAAARVLAHEPLFRHLRVSVMAGILVFAAAYVWARTNLHIQKTLVMPAMSALGDDNWSVVRQLRFFKPRVHPGGHVAILEDPFHNWDMLFLAELWFRDKSIDIHVQRHGPLTAEELAKMDAVFTFKNGHLVQLR